MKKLMTTVLGLSLGIGASALLLAQDKGKEPSKEAPKDGKGGKDGKGKGDGKGKDEKGKDEKGK